MTASLGVGVGQMVYGVVTTAWGWAVATDFRGVVTKLKRAVAPSPAWSMSNPWRRPQLMPFSVGFYRAIGGVFVLAGPVFFIVGVVNAV